jgi:hypothetical protein
VEFVRDLTVNRSGIVPAELNEHGGY